MSREQPIILNGHPLIPGGGPFVFGVLNVTPDSFSDGGRFRNVTEAIEAGCRMAEEGADVIDMGGESTRPGSAPVPADEQIRRATPVIAGLVERLGKNGPAVSIDTRLAGVAKRAIEAGATMVNDVSALRDDPEMAPLVSGTGTVLILMHMKGTPATMQQSPAYDNVVAEVCAFLGERVEAARTAGIARDRIIVDPGIGFGKTTEHNLTILREIATLRSLGVPVLVGPSRKRFIGEVLGIERPADRLTGTLAAVAACALAGIECIRVHDVGPARQVADMCAAIRGERTR